jgi:hypothetical protein
MLKSLKHARFVAALAVGSMTLATTSAEARDRYYGNRGDDRAVAAIAGGVVGLALGAAIASSNRDRYYDDGYYYGRPRGGYYYRDHPRYRNGYPRYQNSYRYDRRAYRGWDNRRYRGGWGY